jgi:hypothetical protein
LNDTRSDEILDALTILSLDTAPPDCSIDEGKIDEELSMPETKKPTVDRSAYSIALQKFDAAICEATAVSQATANRFVASNVGHASKVFTRMCGAGVAMIRATPLSRWISSDFDDWQFAAVAGHARALLDGYLLFSYLIEPPKSEAELKTRINVMHLNDCTRRIELHTNLGNTDDIAGFEQQRTELQKRLKENEFFAILPTSVQKQCLKGRFLMIDNRDAMLAKVDFEKGLFDALYDLWSQHIHILPMSFYRIEPNGRGTGLENNTDRAYIAQALDVCAALLAEATDRMVGQFPDAAAARKGTNSTFSPGPASNLPKKGKPAKKNGDDTSGYLPFAKSELTAAIKKTLGK